MLDSFIKKKKKKLLFDIIGIINHTSDNTLKLTHDIGIQLVPLFTFDKMRVLFNTTYQKYSQLGVFLSNSLETETKPMGL